MSNKTIVLFVVLLILVVSGMFYYSYLYKQEQLKSLDGSATTTAASTLEDKFSISRIDGKHFYRDGVHTVVGKIALPTSCDLLTTDVMVAESMPEQVTLTFTVTDTTDSCAKVATDRPYKIIFSASNQADIKAKFMGELVDLNLVEASPEENPDDFDLFNKG